MFCPSTCPFPPLKSGTPRATQPVTKRQKIWSAGPLPCLLTATKINLFCPQFFTLSTKNWNLNFCSIKNSLKRTRLCINIIPTYVWWIDWTINRWTSCRDTRTNVISQLQFLQNWGSVKVYGPLNVMNDLCCLCYMLHNQKFLSVNVYVRWDFLGSGSKRDRMQEDSIYTSLCLFYISKPVVRCFSQYTRGSFASKELHPGARSSQHLEASTSFLKASVTLWELQLVSGELQPVCWRLQHAFSYSTQHLSQILQIYLNQSALNDGHMQRFSQLFLFGACRDPVIPWNGYECEWKHILLGL